jgi:hypothetical protein
MKLTQDQIYSFKLNSGEEIVAKVTSIGDNTFTMTEPVAVAPGPQGMGLVPAMFTVEAGTEITVNKSSLAYFGLTDTTVKNKYIEATTGLKLPEKRLVLG